MYICNDCYSPCVACIILCFLCLSTINEGIICARHTCPICEWCSIAHYELSPSTAWRREYGALTHIVLEKPGQDALYILTAWNTAEKQA